MATRQDKDLLSYTDLGDGTFARKVAIISGADGTLFTWDYISLTEAATTDTYTYKTGGSGGTTTATIVITYTSSTKLTIDNITRTVV